MAGVGEYTGIRTTAGSLLDTNILHLRQHSQRGAQLEGRGEVLQREGGQPGHVLGLQGGGRHLGVEQGHQGGGQALAEVTIQGGPIGRQQPHLGRGNCASMPHVTTSVTLVMTAGSGLVDVFMPFK